MVTISFRHKSFKHYYKIKQRKPNAKLQVREENMTSCQFTCIEESLHLISMIEKTQVRVNIKITPINKFYLRTSD